MKVINFDRQNEVLVKDFIAMMKNEDMEKPLLVGGTALRSVFIGKSIVSVDNEEIDLYNE
jgi:hypothetical protein